MTPGPYSSDFRRQTSDYGESVLCILGASGLAVASDIDGTDAEGVLFALRLARSALSEEAVEKLAAIISYRRTKLDGSASIARAVLAALVEGVTDAD